MDELEKDLRDRGNHKDTQPWWNDGDKMGGMAASILMVAAAIAAALIIVGLATRVFVWITPGI